MSGDPISGPLSREELRDLASAPYGQAVRTIRQHDPMFGRAPGEMIKWRVTIAQELVQTGYVIVEAGTSQEAEDIANKMPDSKITWTDSEPGMSSIEDVEPES